MPRGDRNDDDEVQEGKKEEGKPTEQGIVEVEINHTLLNNKLNFIIAQLDLIVPKKK